MSLLRLKLFIVYSLPIGIQTNLLDMVYLAIHYSAKPVSFVEAHPQRHWNSSHAQFSENHDFEDAVFSLWDALLPPSLCTQYAWHVWSIAERPLRQEQSKQGKDY